MQKTTAGSATKVPTEVFGSVTAVIPCWNASATVARAIESVISQHYPVREILIVDDASTDSSVDVVSRLAERQPMGNLRILKLASNSGPGAARNCGWDSASTDYVAFLDADDAWHPQKLELQLAVMSANRNLLVTGTCSEPAPAAASHLSDPAIDGPHSLCQMLISNRILTRSAVVQNDVQYRFGGRDVTEDYLLWLEIVADGGEVATLKSPLAWTYKPEFDQGGYSGRLWKHETRELRALRSLHASGRVGCLTLLWSSVWSLVKFLRRGLLRLTRAAP